MASDVFQAVFGFCIAKTVCAVCGMGVRGEGLGGSWSKLSVKCAWKESARSSNISACCSTVTMLKFEQSCSPLLGTLTR